MDTFTIFNGILTSIVRMFVFFLNFIVCDIIIIFIIIIITVTYRALLTRAERRRTAI